MLPIDGKRGFARGSNNERESHIEQEAKRYARSIGYWVRKFKTPARRSAPDGIFASAFGFVFWIEFKAQGKVPTPLQLAEHADMRAHGLIVYVVDNLQDAKVILDRHCL